MGQTRHVSLFMHTGRFLLLLIANVLGEDTDLTATVSNDCTPSAARPKQRTAFGGPDDNCCGLQVPPGFDLIPVSRVSRRLVIPSAEVNLQLSPFKRANDRDPSYYIAGKERAVLLDPKSPIPGSFDDTASRPLADNQTVALKTAPQSVLDISNIRLSGVAGAVLFTFKPEAEDAHTTLSFLLWHPCCHSSDAVPATSDIASNTSLWLENPSGCFVELSFVIVETR